MYKAFFFLNEKEKLEDNLQDTLENRPQRARVKAL